MDDTMDSITRFGGEVSAELDSHLAEAARTWRQKPTAERSLLRALELDPRCLPAYFALYKFYFYSGRLLEAERIVRTALEAAADQCGIAPDWSTLTATSADWNDTAGPAHFYLFSLKALAFIRLRQRQPDEAAALLDKLAELDSGDGVGASVIRSLAEGTAAD
jgi:tetratricopeptide (TPR) repeat protein